MTCAELAGTAAALSLLRRFTPRLSRTARPDGTTASGCESCDCPEGLNGAECCLPVASVETCMSSIAGLEHRGSVCRTKATAHHRRVKDSAGFNINPAGSHI